MKEKLQKTQNTSTGPQHTRLGPCNNEKFWVVYAKNIPVVIVCAYVKASQLSAIHPSRERIIVLYINSMAMLSSMAWESCDYQMGTFKS